MKLISILIYCSLLISCATVSPLSGGTKDTQPPKVISSIPDSSQSLFYSTEIRLNLDEYFTIQNLQNELIISPPFDKPVTSKIKGKSLIIELPSYPLVQTTYQFHFGSAIRDVNEGNILKDYKLVFSTGAYLDSGMIHGLVINPKTLEPQIKHKVILYKGFNDSNVFKKLPYYLTYTDSFGHFTLNNIADTSYQIVSLNDKNLNNKLDAAEEIGFIKTPITPSNQENIIYTSVYPDTRPYYIKSSKCLQNGVFLISFNKPVDLTKVAVYAKSLSQTYTKQQNIPFNLNSTGDAIQCYISEHDANTLSNDSIPLSIIISSDTFNITLLNNAKDKLEPKPTLKSVGILPTNPIVLESNTPILKTVAANMSLFNITDSVQIQPITASFANPFQLDLSAAILPGKEYQLVIPPTSIYYFNNQSTTNDTFFVRTFKDIELGEIELLVSIDTLLLNQQHYIKIEIAPKPILNQKTANVFSSTISNDTTIYIKQLLPGEYFVKAFIDFDGDGSWTDGNFENKTLPEQIFIKKEPITVRANWQNKNIRFNIN